MSGAGGRVSPRRATYFLLLRQKKVGKEKATLLWASLRCATGNLRCSLFAGSAQTRCAQTRAALIREKLRSSAPPEGRGSGRRFARPAEQPTADTNPKDAPWRVDPLSPGPLWACRVAQRNGDQRDACLSEASLRPAPVLRATQVARSFAAGHAQWGRLSFAYSLARQRKVSRPPGRDPAPASARAQLPNSPQA